MSHRATIFFTIFQRLKQMPHLFEFGRIVLLFAIAVSLTLFITDNDVFAGKLFQSPPTSPAPPPAEPPPAEPPPAEQPPAEESTTEETTTEQSTTEQSTTEETTTEETTTEQSTTEEGASPVSPVLSTDNTPPPLAQPTPIPRADREDTFIDEEAQTESPNFILDQVELVDTFVVGGAYIWLCCGVGLFLLIPLIFLLLQIRGKLKIRRENDF